MTPTTFPLSKAAVEAADKALAMGAGAANILRAALAAWEPSAEQQHEAVVAYLKRPRDGKISAGFRDSLLAAVRTETSE